jgi:hypothetical protein
MERERVRKPHAAEHVAVIAPEGMQRDDQRQPVAWPVTWRVRDRVPDGTAPGPREEGS